jgi:K+-sensing histidine kinase KdpD
LRRLSARRIKTNLEPNLPSIALDRIQVLQVLVNLIRNGIEAVDAVVDGARALLIRSSRDGPYAICVEVRDSGTGIEDAERGIEPFFTTKQHGMGMGLAICRSIVESHGVRLWMANNTPRGAIVGFTLPLTASEMRMPTRDAPPPTCRLTSYCPTSPLSARYLVVLLIGFRGSRADVGVAVHERVESAGPMTASSTS